MERHLFDEALSAEEREVLFTELAYLMWDFTNGLVEIEEIPHDPILFEHWCAEKISSQGWDVGTTQSSGDQGVDVIAKRDLKTVSVQCKRYSKPVGNQAVQEVIAGKSFYSTSYACVISTGGFTSSAIDLARASQVRLLDASEIANFTSLFGFKAISPVREGHLNELEKFIVAKKLEQVLELEFALPEEIALCQLMKLALNVSPESDTTGYGATFKRLQATLGDLLPGARKKLDGVSGATDSLDSIRLTFSRKEVLILLWLTGFFCLNSTIAVTSKPDDPNALALRDSKNPKIRDALKSGLPVDVPIYEVFDHTTGQEIQGAFGSLLAVVSLEPNLVAKMPEGLDFICQDHPFLKANIA